MPFALTRRVGLWRPHGWPGLEVGWLLAREAWGHGYATEAARASVEHAWLTTDVPRLISLIAFGNAASVRVAEKIGETFERDVENAPFRHSYGLWSLGERMAP